MNPEASSAELSAFAVQASCYLMEGREWRTADAGRGMAKIRRPQPLGNSRKTSYFTIESLLVLICLTALLLILPLILPPLPPPPFLFLFVPIGILSVLAILAFMPSDVRNITSPYL